VILRRFGCSGLKNRTETTEQDSKKETHLLQQAGFFLF